MYQKKIEVKYTIYGEKCQQHSLKYIFFYLNIIENKYEHLI